MMRIFLAESDPELRVGLQFLINQQPGIQVIGIAVNGNDLPSQVVASRPDVIVLDWKLPGKPMVELLADIQALDLLATKANTPKKLIELLGIIKSETLKSAPRSTKGE